MQFALLSDIHNLQRDIHRANIYKSDAILVAGDLADNRIHAINHNEVLNVLSWLNSFNKPTFVVAGNHDVAIEAGMVDFTQFNNITLLNHESTNFYGINIFGSPYTPSFGIGWAYNVKRPKLQKYWNSIPTDTDIIITHGPPKYILDETLHTNGLQRVGCKSLFNKVMEIKPKLHVFGHIHDEKNIFNNGRFTMNNIDFVNASIARNHTYVLNEPILYTYS